jgi:hypothetical protein
MNFTCEASPGLFNVNQFLAATLFNTVMTFIQQMSVLLIAIVVLVMFHL